MSGVGLAHSSIETCESRWSDGASKQSFPERKHGKHWRFSSMEQEAKGIRYQSATHPKVQGLMHHVNEQTLMMEHRKQARKKATGIDGV